MTSCMYMYIYMYVVGLASVDIIVYMFVYIHVYLADESTISDGESPLLFLSSSSDSQSPSDPCSSDWIKSLGLSMADKVRLVEGEWLSANHVSAYQRLLKKSFPCQHGLQDTCLLSKGKWLSIPTDFVQVIFIASGHWACLSNKLSSDGSVDLYDSIPSIGSSVIKQVCAILKSQESKVSINIVNVQMQAGGSDCGLFAVAMATDLCRGVDPYNLHYHQEQMRPHLKTCFERLTITSFPASLQSSKKQRLLHTETVDIYCICRFPEQLPMANCDICEMWFHSECVNVPSRVFEDENTSWICPTCMYMYM